MDIKGIIAICFGILIVIAIIAGLLGAGEKGDE